MYEVGDFLLIDARTDVVVAVSGNTQFWDDDDNQPSIAYDQAHYVVVVVQSEPSMV